MPNDFTWLFLAALAAATLMRLWLALRQMAHVRAHRDAVPPGFADVMPLAAHRKAAEALAGPHGAPRPASDLAARIEQARGFYAGVGAREVRRPAFMSLLNAAVALVLLASSLKLALRGLGVLE